MSGVEMNVDELLKRSEAWVPVLLEYSGKVTLALITLAGRPRSESAAGTAGEKPADAEAPFLTSMSLSLT